MKIPKKEVLELAYFFLMLIPFFLIVAFLKLKIIIAIFQVIFLTIILFWILGFSFIFGLIFEKIKQKTKSEEIYNS